MAAATDPPASSRAAHLGLPDQRIRPMRRGRTDVSSPRQQRPPDQLSREVTMTTATSTQPRGSALATWATQQRKLQPRRFTAEQAGLRFAFYGRMSTMDHQDRASSWRWQYS